MVSPDYIDREGHAHWTSNSVPQHSGVHGYPVMQFTGLKDANDKDIYDGDIVSVIHTDRPNVARAEKTFNCPVVWDDQDGGWQYEWPKDYGRFRCGDNLRHTEVIGNIYENPELLK